MFSHSLWFIITHLLSHVAIYKTVSTCTQEVLCDGRAGARPQLSPFQLKECTGGFLFTSNSWDIWIGMRPDLLTPAFVACSTNMEEGLVKLSICNDIRERLVFMWRSGTFLLYSYAVPFWTGECHQDWWCWPLGCYVIRGSTLTYLRLCHSSTHPSTLLHVMSYTRPSPALVLQSTNAGVRKSGYKARFMEGWISMCTDSCLKIGSTYDITLCVWCWWELWPLLSWGI